jgi:VWFA-related protein
MFRDRGAGRILLGLIAASASVAVAVAQAQFPGPPTPQHPIFRAGATLVAVDVYPMRDGRVIEGLTPADFEVKEDGKAQSVEFFEFLKFGSNPSDSERLDPQTAEEGERLVADPHHRAFVAYFDTYHLLTAAAQKFRAPVMDFLERTIGSTDYFAALNPDTPIAGLTFGQRTETIAHDVDLYYPIVATANARYLPVSAHEQWLRACYGGRWGDARADDALLTELFSRWRMDLVMKGLTDLTAKLATIREERTDVLLLSDGWALEGPDSHLLDSLWHIVPSTPTAGVLNGRLAPNGAVQAAGGPPDADMCDGELSRLAGLSFVESFRILREDALRRNVAFFPISPSGYEVFTDSASSFAHVDQSLDSLRVLATTTNGQAIVRMNDFRAPMLALADAMSSYYLLGYYTTNTKVDSKYRTIDVSVKAPGVMVTARHGYVATPDPVVTRTVDSAGPSPEATALGTLATIDSQPSLYASASTSGNDVAVAVEVSDAQAAAVASGADVRVTLAGAAGTPPLTAAGRINAGARSALVRLTFGQSAGPWEAKVDVGAPAEGLSSAVTVTRPALTALVSDPIVYRATPSPRSPLWPSAAHLFSRTDRLHLEWVMSGPLDSQIGRLLDRRGQPLAVGVTLTEPPNPDRLMLVGDVSLAPLAPGDYLVELVVARGSTSERHLVAIRIGG